jgi:hypothetical protein
MEERQKDERRGHQLDEELQKACQSACQMGMACAPCWECQWEEDREQASQWGGSGASQRRRSTHRRLVPSQKVQGQKVRHQRERQQMMHRRLKWVQERDLERACQTDEHSVHQEDGR